MKKFVFICFLFAACSQEDLSKKAAEEIMATDKAMSKTATEIGFNHALLHYAGDGFVKLNNGTFPVIGKLAFSEKIMAQKDIRTITWQPEDAEASVAGDLGYSWGNWKLITNDTTIYGNYFSAWKKNSNGSWGLVLDGGNSTPQPR